MSVFPGYHISFIEQEVTDTVTHLYEVGTKILFPKTSEESFAIAVVIT